MSSGRRQFLQALAAAAASSAFASSASPTLVRYPYLQDVRRHRATIRWTTRELAAGAVEFWDDRGTLARVAAEVESFQPAATGMRFAYHRYEAILPKLQPGSEYRYRVLVDDRPVTNDVLQFRTSGVQAFRFLAFGDSGTGSEEQKQLSAMMRAEPARFVIHTGDLVYPTGTFERYEALYFELYRELMKDTPFFPCPGNHDYYEFRCQPYLTLHSVPQESIPREEAGRYYSFDWANAHFVSLDTNEALEAAAQGSGKMLEWLDRDLAACRKFWRIVYLHHPAYSAGKHANSYEADQVRKWIVPILEKHRVPLVLNGHEHSYQCSYPIRNGSIAESGPSTVYITTGGGGADLHPVSSSELVRVAISEHHYVACEVSGAKAQLRATSVNGRELDSVTVAPQPVLRDQPVVNAADYGTKIACGGLAAILGWQFAAEDVSATRYPLPRTAAGVSVQLNGKALPLLLASADQINVQLPYDILGPAELTVRNPNGSVSSSIFVEPVAPAIFDGAVFHQGGVQVSEDAPASAGDTVQVYLTGLGAVVGSVQEGQVSSGVRVAARVEVRLGDQTIVPEFAGLADGVAGVNVVRFRMPLTLPRPALPLSVLAAGVPSNPVILRVRPSFPLAAQDAVAGAGSL